jgi:hypothetical protein
MGAACSDRQDAENVSADFCGSILSIWRDWGQEENDPVGPRSYLLPSIKPLHWF